MSLFYLDVRLLEFDRKGGEETHKNLTVLAFTQTLKVSIYWNSKNIARYTQKEEKSMWFNTTDIFISKFFREKNYKKFP